MRVGAMFLGGWDARLPQKKKHPIGAGCIEDC